jgi:hypothetical protein
MIPMPYGEKTMLQPFQIKDCALILRMSGQRAAVNMRELRDRIEVCPADSIYHHFCQTQLRPTFDDPDYRNDFAVWALRGLNDRVLAERLGILNPYEFENIEALRIAVLDILDLRLNELTHVPWARRGEEFYFRQAMTVVFDTGKTIERPEDLPSAISQMTTSSIYYHFLEARRRVEAGLDDFSAWLKLWEPAGEALINAFRALDFYFLNLKELQAELHRVAASIIKSEEKI